MSIQGYTGIYRRIQEHTRVYDTDASKQTSYQTADVRDIIIIIIALGVLELQSKRDNVGYSEWYIK